jgi:methylenetetrahydrofolate reductase (NADH)
MYLAASPQTSEIGVRELVENFSIEILPKDAASIFDGRCALRDGTRVYIAYRSGTIDEIVAAAQIVRSRHLVPIPHIPARRFTGLPQLARFLGALQSKAGVTRVLLLGGDPTPPVGALDAAIDVLRSGVLEDHGIRCIGVAGHPEGHAAVSQSRLRSALLRKCEYAAKAGLEIHVVTQFLFNPRALWSWHADFIERTVPGIAIDVGLPGVVETPALLRYAKHCGVRPSFSLLAASARRTCQLATTFSPGELLVDLATAPRRARRPAFRSLHFYPFGSPERTAAWLHALQSGAFWVDDRKKAIRLTRIGDLSIAPGATGTAR